MNTGEWNIQYAIRSGEWLQPLILVAGLIVAAWGFRRCRKWGYLVVAVYFALSAFMLVAMPSINRAIQARQSPAEDAQVRQKIDAAINEAVDKVLAEAGRPHGVPVTRTLHFPLGQLILVAGLWLLVKREPCYPMTTKQDDQQPPA